MTEERSASPRPESWVKGCAVAVRPRFVVGGWQAAGVRYRSTRLSVYLAKHHVIWCPRHRRRVIDGRVEARLKQLSGDVVAECGGEVIQLETMPDQVHLLVEVPPTVPLSALTQTLKGRTSRQLRTEFPHLQRLPALWSPSWFVSTVGWVPLEVVRRHVENQKWAG